MNPRLCINAERVIEIELLKYPEEHTDGLLSVTAADCFIRDQAARRKLDERTVKAYSLDLKDLHLWLSERGIPAADGKSVGDYLDYLVTERGLKRSTVARKYSVFNGYLEYQRKQGTLESSGQAALPDLEDEDGEERIVLTKEEVDSFFTAMEREYADLDNGFRRMVCLRDRVMMGLLFYHQIEVSELLRLKVSDYNRKTGVLTVRKKRGKPRQEYLYARGMRDSLKTWLDEHGYFEKGNEYDSYLFLSKMGRPLSMKMVILVFDKYRELAGIRKKCTPKDLKFSMDGYAQELLMESVGGGEEEKQIGRFMR